MPNELDHRLANIETLLDKIFEILNGAKGLVTKVELHEQKMNSLPSPGMLRFHATIGGGVVVFLGLIGYAIIKLVG